MAYPLISSKLELNSSALPMWRDQVAEPQTPNEWFAAKFKSHTEQFGAAFLELRETTCDGFTRITPLSINVDFFASTFSDPELGLSTVYFEPEMQFYYLEPLQQIYKPTSSEKMQNLYRGLLLRSAQELNSDTNKLNLFVEFRSDKIAKAVTNRAKSVLAANHTFFSPDSPHQRVKGPELIERVARVFVDSLLTSEPGQILKLHEAHTSFLSLLKQRDLPEIKRSDFKAVVAPLIREQFDVALRNDLSADDRQGVRGWKGVKLLQSLPA